jgi:hypothetical protein
MIAEWKRTDYTLRMPASATVQEQAATYGTPPSREVLEMAQQAVRDFHECFWVVG